MCSMHGKFVSSAVHEKRVKSKFGKGEDGIGVINMDGLLQIWVFTCVVVYVFCGFLNHMLLAH